MAKYTGRSILRKEDERLLRGKAAFMDDLSEPAGCLHLAFVRSPHPHAKVLGIDKREAEALPGVVGVFTGADIAAWTEPFGTPLGEGLPLLKHPHMAVDVARHAGESVAVIAAVDPYVAEDALELVQVDYEVLPVTVSIEDALAEGSPRVHDYLQSNVVFRRQHAIDGTDEVFKRADHVFSDTFRSHRLAAVTLETRGFIASFDTGQDKLTFWGAAQMAHKLRWELAEALNVPENSVRVVIPDVGGGFGMKAQTYPEEISGAALSRHLGRPVKWTQDRQDDLLTSTHARDYRLEVSLAMSKDGLIQGLRAKIATNIGAYSTWATTAGIEAGGAGLFMIGPYRLKHYAYDTCAVVSNKTPVGVYRGVAAPACAFSVEMLMDRAAKALGIDPVELRRRNFVRPSDLPYINAVGIPFDTASHEACLDRVLEMSGYHEFKRTHSGKLGADGKLRGIGVAPIIEHTGQGSSRMRARGQTSRTPGFDGASIRMEPDGKAVVYVSHTTQGQGHMTVFAQLAADELGIPIEHVTVEEGDTALMPFGTGTVASRGAVSGGGAVIRGSRHIADKLRRIAGHILEASAQDIELAGGKASVVGVPNLSIEIKALAASAYFVGMHKLPEGEAFGLDRVEFYDPPNSSYSNATHAAIVAIDPATGRVAVERYFVVHDCGRILNPMIVDGQVQGGIAQGLGAVLMEGVAYSEEGQPLTTTLLDYVIPTSADVPHIELDHFETPSTITEGGMKGAGEGGVIGAVPAISLAIANALAEYNPKITRLPLTPTAIIELMGMK